MRKLIFFFIALFSINIALAIPPKPPIGFRWVLVPYLSDEFNGTELNADKWYDYHPYWKGRPPAKFVPEAITLDDGIMQIKNGVLDTPDGDFSLSSGAVVSKSGDAHYGYYECSFKASKVSMSTTFWLSTYSTIPINETECTGDKYGHELDIVEVIGDAKTWPNFKTHMNSNTHFHYYDCNGKRETFSAGASTKLSSEVSTEYHTYGAWWKNATEVVFYNDNKKGKTVDFRTDASSQPFNRPMRIMMVTETYDWEVVPSLEDLADNSRNTSYYDWIRTYKLLPINDTLELKETASIISNGGFETGDFSNWIGWGGNPREVVTGNQYSGNYAVHIVGGGAPEQQVDLKPNTEYTLSCYAKIVKGTVSLGIKYNTADDITLGSIKCTDSEYTKKSVTFTTGESGNCKLYFYAASGTDEGYADDFEIVATVESIDSTIQETPIIYKEELQISEYDSLSDNNYFSFTYDYKANVDRELLVNIEDLNNQLIHSEKIATMAGYGVNSIQIELATKPDLGNYQVTTELKSIEKDSTIALESFNLKVVNDLSTGLIEDRIQQPVVFPNPTNSILYVNNINILANYKIFNTSGSLVLSGKGFLSEGIEISGLKNGIYVLHFTHDNQTYNLRFNVLNK